MNPIRNDGSAAATPPARTAHQGHARRRTTNTVPASASSTSSVAVGGERRARRGGLERVAADVGCSRPVPHERCEALEADRVRAEVVQQRGRQEVDAEERVVVPGEPRLPRRARQRQLLTPPRHLDERAELRVRRPEVDRCTSGCEGGREHDRSCDLAPAIPCAHHHQHTDEADGEHRAEPHRRPGEHRHRRERTGEHRVPSRRLAREPECVHERPRAQRGAPHLGLVVHARPTGEHQQR